MLDETRTPVMWSVDPAHPGGTECLLAYTVDEDGSLRVLDMVFLDVTRHSND